MFLRGLSGVPLISEVPANDVSNDLCLAPKWIWQKKTQGRGRE